MAQGEPQLWFGKRDGRLKFGPITWQGRAVTFLYLFLVAVAIFTYSQLALTAVVVVFYTIAFSFVGRAEVRPDEALAPRLLTAGRPAAWRGHLRRAGRRHSPATPAT